MMQELIKRMDDLLDALGSKNHDVDIKLSDAVKQVGKIQDELLKNRAEIDNLRRIVVGKDGTNGLNSNVKTILNRIDKIDILLGQYTSQVEKAIELEFQRREVTMSQIQGRLSQLDIAVKDFRAAFKQLEENKFNYSWIIFGFIITLVVSIAGIIVSFVKG